jgi:opacity protein-like surface antigen
MSDVWSASVGYLFTPYFGIDAAFMHLGEIKYIATGTLQGAVDSQYLETTNEISSHGPALSLIIRLPLSESWAVDVRAGDYLGKTTSDNNTAAGSNSEFVAESKATSSLLAGVGAAYSFAGHWTFRIDYLHVHQTGDQETGGKFSVNLATAGIAFTF